MNRVTVGFISGLLFAVGLGVSGMTLPAKVVGFLDVFGDWDPSLAFVMAGAIGVHVLASRLLARPSTTSQRSATDQPQRIDRSLIVGASVFGVGWGLVGYCPGPAVVGLAGFDSRTAVFVAAMALGMIAFRWLKPRR